MDLLKVPIVDALNFAVFNTCLRAASQVIRIDTEGTEFEGTQLLTVLKTLCCDQDFLLQHISNVYDLIHAGLSEQDIMDKHIARASIVAYMFESMAAYDRVCEESSYEKFMENAVDLHLAGRNLKDYLSYKNTFLEFLAAVQTDDSEEDVLLSENSLSTILQTSNSNADTEFEHLVPVNIVQGIFNNAILILDR